LFFPPTIKISLERISIAYTLIIVEKEQIITILMLFLIPSSVLLRLFFISNSADFVSGGVKYFCPGRKLP